VTTALDRLTLALADRYRVERELGQGGMATVYLAEDLKHGRKVAIKVLHPELSAVIGGERFLTEIKVTASLQHPHILGLIDSGEADGLLYYVMPFIEGETLRGRLTREKQLPVEDALRLTKEVASALEFAHKRGIVHRDIKPENILLQDGSALVADFGIALAVQQAGGSRMTQTGMSLGTPAYMSPEQAMGERELGPRSDVYALGAMAYEMLAGEPPFTGPNSQAIMAKVLTEAPLSLRAKRPTVSAAVEHAVLVALQKLPADRFGSAREFAEALDGKGGTYAATVAVPSSAPVRVRRGPRLALAAGAAALASLVFGAGWFLHTGATGTPEPPVVTRFSITLADAARYEDITEPIAYARDGSVIAYRTRGGIALRYLDRLDAVAVPDARRGTYPFFSPDGRWLGFRDGVRLLKLPVAGGTAVVICASCPGFAGDWGIDDTVRFHAPSPRNSASRVLMAVPASGGTAHVIAAPDSGSTDAYRTPILLPDRRTVLFTLRSGESDWLAALDGRTGVVTRFEQAGSNPRWVSSGYVVLANLNQSLVAVPFDLRTRRPTGPSVPIADHVGVDPSGQAYAGISDRGAMIFEPSVTETKRTLEVVSSAGVAERVVPESRSFAGPRLSPDGRRLALSIAADEGGTDVWTLDLSQRVWSRMTTNGKSEHPIWTPDGRRLVYSSDADLWWMPADGSGKPEVLLTASGARFAGSVTPDGRELVFQEFGSPTGGIRRLVFDSAPAATVILPPAFDEAAPSLSPDGRWLAYQSEESGRSDVYVRPYPGPGPRVSVSVQGGAEPAWSSDGRSLYYRVGDSLVVASITTGDGFAVTGRRPVFVGRYRPGGRFREYDVSADGRRFYMVSGSETASSFTVVNGFFDRLAFDQRRRH